VLTAAVLAPELSTVRGEDDGAAVFDRGGLDTEAATGYGKKA
jgi:hypothetical protein